MRRAFTLLELLVVVVMIAFVVSVVLSQCSEVKTNTPTPKRGYTIHHRHADGTVDCYHTLSVYTTYGQLQFKDGDRWVYLWGDVTMEQDALPEKK